MTGAHPFGAFRQKNCTVKFTAKQKKKQFLALFTQGL